DLAGAKAEVRALQGQATLAEADLAAAQAAAKAAQDAVAETQVEHQRDATDLARYQKLLEHESVSRQMVDHARAAAEMSAAHVKALESQVAAAQAQVATAQAGVDVAQLKVKQAQAEADSKAAAEDESRAKLKASETVAAQVASAEATVKERAAAVEQAQARLEAAKLQLSYTTVTAPRAGTVTMSQILTGTYVQPGQTMLALVSKAVWVTANFKETQLSDMQVGQPVAVFVDAFPGVEFKARIGSFQRGTGSRFSLLPPENATGNFVKVVQRVPVKILFSDPAQQAKYLLVPGMSVDPQVDITVPGSDGGETHGAGTHAAQAAATGPAPTGTPAVPTPAVGAQAR
ncbi:MAG: HlyD family secretion protein, partial [Planctomycetota bacterium]